LSNADKGAVGLIPALELASLTELFTQQQYQPRSNNEIRLYHPTSSKKGLFHKIHMFCDSVTLMKIPPRSQKVSIINIDYVSSLKKWQHRDRVK